ncbi:hypothetical protein IJ00_02875 [Calothrix sp. 336/3]|nr:hypothetical protein IJ00_02875 [Calothrix sp. 336/3]
MFTGDTPPALSGTLPDFGEGWGGVSCVVLFFQIGITQEKSDIWESEDNSLSLTVTGVQKNRAI